jgi:hypothetical protein
MILLVLLLPLALLALVLGMSVLEDRLDTAVRPGETPRRRRRRFRRALAGRRRSRSHPQPVAAER